MSSISLQQRVARLEDLQNLLSEQPYSIVLRLRLSLAYRDLGYPDLAVGDAYKALLLTDEVAEEGEFHDEAMSAVMEDFGSEQAAQLFATVASQLGFEGLQGAKASDDNDATIWAQKYLSKIAYAILVSCLIDCGCLSSAFEYNTRAIQAYQDTPIFDRYRKTIQEKLQSYFKSRNEDFAEADVDEYPDRGLVRREQYPWNTWEPDRFSEESLNCMNEQMAAVAPKLEIKKTSLLLLAPETPNSCPQKDPIYVDQLGIFAKEDIAPGHLILEEKSLLTAVARLRETRCDACSISLTKAGIDSDDIRTCDECDEIYFCSEECHDLAQDTYHPALCGVNIDQTVPASEASDYLYSLLLTRALALAEVQESHPLELKEVCFIWGDYHGVDVNQNWNMDSTDGVADPFGSIPQTLPFSFKYNILTPLNVLEKMDINIFTQSPRYDTWIFNTLYAKFRGTASARQGLDGRPEVSAVHPMWCMGNHSCDPNVSWDWEGSIRFWTREQLVDWKGRDPSAKPGMQKGEELRGHYCDVRLPVKERREWAVGALGGDCMCPRCVWEEAQERGQTS
ncbi:hypothetical protein M011DRAFT_435013 [Sporormia fimetaria CBS 119925]|uniref:SET domain-containing protein n=1 Tax=Sporormia fimetaria CBS 119925 TaxID=1340428 RepID=A0A6A6VMU7_9PLEO|nr:hypothetical protein M011DRAFT_435013 [Sporormia fimetaria CBS 119925]